MNRQLLAVLGMNPDYCAEKVRWEAFFCKHCGKQIQGA